MNQRFTVDRQSFEQFIAAVSLVQSLQQSVPKKGSQESAPVSLHLLEILRTIDSGELALQSALERVAGLALHIVGGDGAVLWLFTSESLICHAGAGVNVEDARIRTALRSKLHSAGAFGEDPPPKLDLTRTLENCSGSIGSPLAVAILPGEKIAGALAVFSDQSTTFTERNYANLRLLAGLAQYVLTKKMAGRNPQDSLHDSPAENPQTRALLEIHAPSSTERSARSPLLSNVQSPEHLRHVQIDNHALPGVDTRVPLGAEVSERPKIGPALPSFSAPPAPECVPENSLSDNQVCVPQNTLSDNRTWVPENSLSDNQVRVPEHSLSDNQSSVPGSSPSDNQTWAPENSPSGDADESAVRKSSPGGAFNISPALQRWEGWRKRFKSRRDDRVLRHTPEDRQLTQRLKSAALRHAENILQRARNLNVRVNWIAVKQAAPAFVILAVMSFFAGLLTGSRTPITVGSLNATAEASTAPATQNSDNNVNQTAAAILIPEKPTPGPAETSHLQITDRETAATIAELTKYEMRTLRRAAEYGDDQAALQLGMLYELGRGFPQSCSKAAQWVTKAAENGNAAAEYNLGLRYRDGDGVAANLQQAEICLRKAAAQKNSNAERVLAALTSK